MPVDKPVRDLEAVATDTVVHAVDEAILYCRLYDVAPATAVQLTVAPEDVMADDASPPATPHVACAVVVKVDAAEYADVPLAQTVCT